MKRTRGFTLLETVVALAILALALMAIFDLNSGAVANHVYSKHLTVASLLARSKMTDLEQKLYDDGFSADDDEEAGDFSEEGWPTFKWRAKIIAPKTDGVSPDQLIGAIFNLPIGDMGDMGGIASLFGGGAGKEGMPSGQTPAGGGMAGMAMGMAQPMFTQMIDQLTKTVREVHLTVTWKEGTQVESIDVVTHMVSLGPGSDRNGGASAGGGGSSGGGDGDPSSQWVDPATGQVVPSPVPGPNGQMLDPRTRQPLMNRMQWMQQKGGSLNGLQGKGAIR
ncbi:prepilin-type N-terminal cleavage/methylation domain-containing protein [Stigmatella aurantiaca]|uniref:GspI-like general secretion pathway protein I n=1 Tax=Stigmatella aurantiaca (strain DW4/3-1) TaxID=378806 RepID=Q08NC4_STIAD|nr:prepilin-type N-terminal cleavage/methylation domain-containing protein [Stigmatella aurantiaca]ADO70981.1 GspI-like general secretion pathway protein I [Stigmatella aurantiaca DW4/3-1]EAU61981.1 prokaryotic N-terminal methylation motif domain protein [Stigmatella aurantiaca DW4/3-1]